MKFLCGTSTNYGQGMGKLWGLYFEPGRFFGFIKLNRPGDGE
jgi:hypothetical protein